MAQTAYTGIQGSGKSYEVVRGVILPNVAKGRRVVTNVAGLKIAEIGAYCVAKLGADSAKLGEVVAVTNEQVSLPNFFPVENSDNVDSIVQPGDIVILDECWRWYVQGEKLLPAHLTFFRMHRHFTHPETGQSCDVVLIVQSIGDLQRKVVATVEKNFRMQKHKDFGMSNRYVVGIYSGHAQTPKALIEEMQCKYDPEVFALYSSYSQSTAAVKREDQADSRGNIFNRKLFKFAIPLAILGIIGGAWKGYAFFHPDLPVNSASVSGKPDGKKAPDKKPPEVTDVWRLVGVVKQEGFPLFVLADSQGRTRYVSGPPSYKHGPAGYEVVLSNGDVVASWSGPAVAAVGRFGK